MESYSELSEETKKKKIKNPLTHKFEHFQMRSNMKFCQPIPYKTLPRINL